MIELNADMELFRNMSGRMVCALLIPKSYEADFLNLEQNPTISKTGQVHVKIAKPHKPRSTGPGSQNHHLNGHIQQIAMHTGDYFDDVKLHIKRIAVSMGYPHKTNTWGEMVPISERDATTDDCSLLIEAAHLVASELDIHLREE
jgi:hypothetical protein